MPDKIISFIAIAAIVIMIFGAYYFIDHEIAKQRSSIWDDFAKSIGAKHNTFSNFDHEEKIACTTSHGEIVFRAWKEWSPISKVTTSYTEVCGDYAGNIDFTIRRRDWVNSIGESLGLSHSIQTGDTRLNQLYVVASNDTVAIQRYLHDKRLADMINTTVTGSLTASVNSRLISHKEQRFVEDPERLRALYDMMRVLMQHPPE